MCLLVVVVCWCVGMLVALWLCGLVRWCCVVLCCFVPCCVVCGCVWLCMVVVVGCGVWLWWLVVVYGCGGSLWLIVWLVLLMLLLLFQTRALRCDVYVHNDTAMQRQSLRLIGGKSPGSQDSRRPRHLSSRVKNGEKNSSQAILRQQSACQIQGARGNDVRISSA